MTKAAVLYARGSTEEQVKDYSLRQQIAACLAWCEAEGYQVIEECEDGGFSGMFLDRPGLDRAKVEEARRVMQNNHRAPGRGPLLRARARTAHPRARSVANRQHPHDNELWEFDEDGLMCRRDASINDYKIDESERRIFQSAFPGHLLDFLLPRTVARGSDD